jgi:Raf kinase inhibitor-like YbhB/YbcL family protein
MAFRKSLKLAAIGVAVLLVFLLIAFFILHERGRADIADGQSPASLDVGSPSFTNGSPMPTQLTCLGASLSPSIEFSAPPAGTESIAIVMDDASSPFGFVHWIVYNIPSQMRALAEGASSQQKLPSGATEGVNSDDTRTYIGPCHKGHLYAIRVYALDAGANLSPGMTKQQLAAAVKGHVIAEGQLTGIDGGDLNSSNQH